VTQQENPNGTIDTITLTQIGLITTILNDIGITERDCWPKTRDMLITEVLHPYLDAAPYPSSAPNYCSIIGKLNFLAQSTRPNILYVVNSCVCYLNFPNQMHYLTIKQISQYLYGTCTKGLILTPNPRN